MEHDSTTNYYLKKESLIELCVCGVFDLCVGIVQRLASPKMIDIAVGKNFEKAFDRVLKLFCKLASYLLCCGLPCFEMIYLFFFFLDFFAFLLFFILIFFTQQHFSFFFDTTFVSWQAL